MEKTFSFTKKSILFLLLFLGTFSGAFFWMTYTQSQEVKNTGPYLLTADDKFLYFNVNDTLYESDVDGNIIASSTFKHLDLKKPLADIHVYKGILYVLEGKTKTLKSCNLEENRCEFILKAKAKRNQGALKMAFDENTSALYIANSGEHRIDVYDLKTQVSHRFMTMEKLDFPNAILIEEDKIIIADSNNNRVLTLDKKGNILSSFSVKSDVGTAGLKRALKLAHAQDGSWWSINSDIYYDEREVIHYDSKGSALEIFHAEGVSKLSQLTRFNEKIILSDYLGFKLYVLKSNSEMKEFSSILINTELDKYRKERHFWINQKYTTYFLFFLSAVFALLTLFSDAKDKKIVEDDVEIEIEKSAKSESIDLSTLTLLEVDNHGYVWLKPKKSFVNLMRYGLPIVGLIIFTTMYIVRNGILESNFQMKIVFILFSILILGMMLLSKKISEVIIGTNGKDIIIRDVFGRIGEVSAGQVEFNSIRLKAGDATLGLGNQENAVFSQKELDTYIFPLLREDMKIDEVKLILRNLKTFDFKTYAGIIVSIILLIVILGAK